jgi:hypothetical protein
VLDAAAQPIEASERWMTNEESPKLSFSVILHLFIPNCSMLDVGGYDRPREEA